MKRTRRNGADLTLYTAVLLLMTIGVVQVYSSSVFLADIRFAGEHAHYFIKQLLFSGIAVFAMLVFSAIDYRLYLKLLWPAVIVSLALLVVTMFMPEINGSSRWIKIGNYNLQPSEIFKYVMIVLLAGYLAGDGRVQRPQWYKYLVLFAVAAGMGLILLEPDLGTVVVLSAVAVGIMFVGGVSLRKVLLGCVSCALLGFTAVYHFGYKQGRILEYMDSIGDPLKGGYQVKQSILYIGSGGLFGKGIGRGAVKLFFLPEVHTDFIIANFAEEGGFIWVTIVLTLFFVIFWRGLRIASNSQDRFGFFLAFGITLILATSALINIAVTVNLIPTTGMPLPFISYGGSSLLISASAVGVLLNISRRRGRNIPLFEKHE
ncbi:MAG: putative lipid II flippase FtsW [candidate division Zixibacteria bacterium]|nr:putative lipid II flippase FtsW [candidate division Zixibacteria bacterium]